MKYVYCKEPLTKQMLANKLLKNKEAEPSLFRILLITAVTFTTIALIPAKRKPDSLVEWIACAVIILLIFVWAWLATYLDLKKGEKISDIDFKNIRVFDSFGNPDKHFKQFIDECTNGKYYFPYNCSTIDDCLFFGTDNYLVFFYGDIMKLIPAQELLYAYAHAQKSLVEFIILLNSGTKLKLNYDEDNIICAEKFLYNIYGINVGFSREKKRAYKYDSFIFQKECEQIRAAKKAEMEAGIFTSDKEYPYSFSTKETNPRKAAGTYEYEFLILSIVLFVFGILAFINDNEVSVAIIFALLGATSFCVFFLKEF